MALNMGRMARLLRPTTTFSFKFFSSKTRPIKSRLPKYIGLLAFGTVSFYLYDKFRGIDSSSQIARTEPSVNLDLNEIYEKTAVVFLSNPEVRQVLGLPVKITSNNSISDMVRSIDLTRKGTDLFALIAYFVSGSKNSGVVYAKLKMDKATEKFKTESIVLKLNRPDDASQRTEIIIKSGQKSETKN